MKYFCFLIMLFILSGFSVAETITVDDDGPADFRTIQDAVDSAVNGDMVLISEGIYFENLQVTNKSITLASEFINSGIQNDITQTVIDGNDLGAVLTLSNLPDGMTVMGLTIRNGTDGIAPYAKFNISDCYIQNCVDGIDYESGSGGICRNNRFENNSDDGIDLDGAVEVTIENNVIQNNDDDGIEIRLHPYVGPMIEIIIRNNVIVGNGEDGVQFIDYDTVTNRQFLIVNNVISQTAMVGIGCMGSGNTTENYEAADIPEQVTVINNTFVANEYGITGGDNMTVVNNIFIQTNQTALKKVDGFSSAIYNNFWQNGIDFDGTAPSQTNSFVDPLFADPVNGDYHLRSQYGRWSPALDAWATDPVTSLCVDAGDPNAAWTSELWPHGKRANLGAHGGTPQASMSGSGLGNRCDFNNDDSVDMGDLTRLAGLWLDPDLLLAENVDRTGCVDVFDFSIFSQNWLQ